VKNSEILKTLERRGKELEGFMDGLRFAVFMVDDTYNIRRLNASALDLTGKQQYSDVLGKKCHTIFFQKSNPCSFCPRRKQEGTLADLFKSYFREDQLIKSEVEAAPVSKSLHLAQHQYVIESEMHGHLLIETIQDITQEKELEEENYRNQNLASLGRVIQTVAHEIQNPLTGLNFMLQNLKTRFRKNKTISDKFSLMQEDISRATNIVNDLRLATERSNYRLEPVDIIETLKESIEISKRTYSTVFQYKLVVESKTKSTINGNKDKLTQAFLNLIRNSIESYNSEAREEHLKMWLFFREMSSQAGQKTVDGKVLELEIIDNAGGIPENNLKSIFDPYFSTKRNRSINNGMGLAITMKVIKEHAGSIEVESMAHYTRFVLRFSKVNMIGQ
jgi:nitrogen-specific signal transduction histidine kinase